MRALGLAAVTLLGLLAGCSQLLGIEDVVPGDPPPDADTRPDADPAQSASIQATWTILDGYTDDADDSGQCPAAAVHAVVHAQGASTTAVTFPCDAGTGTLPTLALGSYTVWVELTDESGATIYARSEDISVDLGIIGSVEDASLPVDAYNGFLRISWQVAPTPCAATEVVSALSTIVATTAGKDDIRLCTDGESPSTVLSSALPVGAIVTVAALLNAGGASIGSGPAASSTISYGNEIVDLGPLQITRD